MEPFATWIERLKALAVELFWRLGEGWIPKAPEPIISPTDLTVEAHKTVAALRVLLRRFPLWTQGHRRVAEMSLALDDVASTYASAQCLMALSREESPLRGTAHLLLGQSFLRRGDWRSSLLHLERASQLLPNLPRVTEERAAAYMAGKHYSEALSLLETIAGHRMTSEGKAALEFLRSNRSNGDLNPASTPTGIPPSCSS